MQATDPKIVAYFGAPAVAGYGRKAYRLAVGV